MNQGNHDVLGKATQMADAWETVAPQASFAGVTLARFKSTIKRSRESRKTLASLRSQINTGIKGRAATDASTRRLTKSVAHGVLADPAYGPDSQLYSAMGYVPESLRKRGRTNKSQNGNGNGNGNGNDTAPGESQPAA